MENHKWWEAYFPFSGKYKKPLPNQEIAFDVLGKHRAVTVLEAPTGSGKSLIGYTFLKEGQAEQAEGKGPLFYITPNKTLVQQVKSLHSDVNVAYGRSEHECLYYGPDHPFKA